MGSSIWIILLLIAGLAVLGVHLAIAFIVAAAAGLYFALGGWAPTLNLVYQTAFTGIKDYNLMVIPLFTVMGIILAHSGAARDLFSVVNRNLRGVPGRLAVATVGGNALFAAVTGVGIAAAAAFSQIAYPIMRQLDYRRSYAAGAIAGSSVLGLLIPPSVLMIIWAILTDQSVGRLFAAGVLPGLLLAGLYALYCVLYAAFDPSVAPEEPSDAAVAAPTGAARLDEVKGWVGVVLLMVVTLGTIWGGYATPTEGAALGLLGALVLGYAKGMSTAALFDCFVVAGRTVTPLMLLMLGATLYAKLLALEGLPEEVRRMLADFGLGAGGTLLFMVAVWFILGAIIDSISIMLLTVPIFWPIAAALGYEPIMFALIGILVIEAGILTPPFGLGVFVVKAAVPDKNLTLREIFVGVVPYWVLILFVAWLIYMWPPLAQWLPSLL